MTPHLSYLISLSPHLLFLYTSGQPPSTSSNSSSPPYPSPSTISRGYLIFNLTLFVNVVLENVFSVERSSIDIIVCWWGNPLDYCTMLLFLFDCQIHWIGACFLGQLHSIERNSNTCTYCWSLFQLRGILGIISMLICLAHFKNVWSYL